MYSTITSGSAPAGSISPLATPQQRSSVTCPAATEYAGAAAFVSVPSSMLLRDAIYAMNEVFATAAAVVDRQGRLMGWLSQSLLLELFAEDSDRALRSSCHSLLLSEESTFAA